MSDLMMLDDGLEVAEITVQSSPHASEEAGKCIPLFALCYSNSRDFSSNIYHFRKTAWLERNKGAETSGRLGSCNAMLQSWCLPHELPEVEKAAGPLQAVQKDCMPRMQISGRPVHRPFKTVPEVTLFGPLLSFNSPQAKASRDEQDFPPQATRVPETSTELEPGDEIRGRRLNPATITVFKIGFYTL